MEQEKIEKKLMNVQQRRTRNVAHESINDQGFFADAAAEIAKMAAADKYDALECMNATWHDIEDRHIAQIVGLREALEMLEGQFWEEGDRHEIVITPVEVDLESHPKLARGFPTVACENAIAAAKKALADAPGVLFCAEGGLLICEDKDVTDSTVTGEPDGWMFTIDRRLDIDYDGQQVKVLVLKVGGQK